MAAAWRREKKIKAKKRAPVGQGIPLSPAMHASEGMLQAMNGSMPKPQSEAVSRKQLAKMLAQVLQPSPETCNLYMCIYACINENTFIVYFFFTVIKPCLITLTMP